MRAVNIAADRRIAWLEMDRMGRREGSDESAKCMVLVSRLRFGFGPL